MATFVLVHGGWTGAHGFHRVRPLLVAEGHDVFTPSLTGVGERAHLLSPLVDLTTHVHDVVNVVLYEDLDEIVLLGFSYGGAVVTAALAHLADRIREVVYLDAFVPGDGDTVAELAGRPRSSTTDAEPRLAGRPAATPVRRPRRRGVADRAVEDRTRPGASPNRCG